MAVTLAEVHSFKRAPVECLDRLARLDGEPVGCAVATIRPEIAYVLPTVVRGHRRRGGGTRVYEVVPPWARERGPDVIEVPALDNDPESLAYAVKRGFAGDRQGAARRPLPLTYRAAARRSAGGRRDRHQGRAAGARSRDVRGRLRGLPRDVPTHGRTVDDCVPRHHRGQRRWRGHGVARAPKATQIAWAKANCFQELNARNEPTRRFEPPAPT